MPSDGILFATHGNAVISECGRYRYTLERGGRVHGGAGRVNFIMLNPSTATADVDDPTIRRCINFARAWDFDDLVVTNLFALRATDPRELTKVFSADAIGPENDDWLPKVARQANMVVCAWGNHGQLHARGDFVADWLPRLGVNLYALKLSKCGRFPSHPLYLPSSSEPILWRKAVAP
jgi:hypothetical protein